MRQARLFECSVCGPGPVKCRGCGKVLAYQARNTDYEGICEDCGITDDRRIVKNLSELGDFCG